MLLEMPGLTVGPMGAWLAAVGTLRVLHRVDPDATLLFDGDVPIIQTALDTPERDIADRMVFAPVITPWQAGGGWGPKDRQPRHRIALLRQSATPRLALLRDAIAAADKVMARGGDKTTIVRQLRNWGPEQLLPWLDVAVPLHDDPAAARAGQPAAYIAPAPLAGTGGNDGRWDLSTNYHAAILATSPDATPEPDGSTSDRAIIQRRGWIADLLYGTQTEPLVEMSGGPYWPRTGEPPLLNPWAMILATEGLLAFGDGLRRAHGQDGQPWAVPVMDTGVDEPGLGEAWLPMWGQGMTYPEVRLLLGGPRPAWRNHRRELTRVMRPVDMLTAFRAGAWPRGVTGYARYALARRRGQGHEAVPLAVVTPVTPVVWLSLSEAAAQAGVGESTWRSYTARGQAPRADRRDLATGQPQWWAGTVEAYQASRPGSGARTDLDEG
jgi:CRISPR-associated protein Csx17